MSNYILLVGRLCGEDFHWDINVPYNTPVSDEPEVVDGDTQRLIDEAQDTLDYEDDIEDREWHSRGGW